MDTVNDSEIKSLLVYNYRSPLVILFLFFHPNSTGRMLTRKQHHVYYLKRTHIWPVRSLQSFKLTLLTRYNLKGNKRMLLVYSKFVVGLNFLSCLK